MDDTLSTLSIIHAYPPLLIPYSPESGLERGE